MTVSLDILGGLIFSVPAALLVLLGREFFILQFRGAIPESNLWQKGSVNALTRVDLWSFFLVSLWGFGWGGLVQKGRKETMLTFILAQLWFVLIAVIVIIYVKLNHPVEGGYIYLLMHEVLRQAWTLHLINYIPIPPFDASVFYVPNINQNIRYALKIIVTILLIFGVSENSFINGLDFVNWLNLGE